MRGGQDEGIEEGESKVDLGSDDNDGGKVIS